MLRAENEDWCRVIVSPRIRWSRAKTQSSQRGMIRMLDTIHCTYHRDKSINCDKTTLRPSPPSAVR